jgi:hypothetical protein
MHGIANPESRGFKSLLLLQNYEEWLSWFKAAVLKTVVRESGP